MVELCEVVLKLVVKYELDKGIFFLLREVMGFVFVMLFGLFGFVGSWVKLLFMICLFLFFFLCFCVFVEIDVDG